MAFLDLRPLTEGHTLVIPKMHYVDIFDIPEEQLSKVHKVAKQVSSAIKKATNSDGISIIQQNGKAAGQEIFHFHVHAVPRFEGQKLPGFSTLREAEERNLTTQQRKLSNDSKPRLCLCVSAQDFLILHISAFL